MQCAMLEQTLIWYARNFPVQRGKVRVVNNLWRLAAGDRGVNRTAVLTHGGLRAPCDLTEMLQRQFYFFGTYFLERDILALWTDMARDAKVVFDVGANGGIYSLAALAENPGARVHAFEPTPEIAERLRATAALNGLPQLHVEEMAVSDTPGEKTLRRCRGGGDESNEGMNFLIEATATDGDEVVAADTLDRFCAARGIERIDLLKMDIQGHEPAALRGAQGLLSAGRIGSIFLELNWGERAEACAATQCVEMLEAHGYLFAAPTVRPAWKTAGPWLRGLADVVAAKPDRTALS